MTVALEPLDALVGLLAGRRVVALTGAGCSTESGIPDYRGPGTLQRARNPIQWREFASDPEARRRYWARAAIGWRKFGRAKPNAAHHALAELERAGRIAGVITQNVDRLHRDAGSRRLVELHGAIDEVVCLGCGGITPRAAMQARLEQLNPGWADRHAEIAPDGDAEVPADAVIGFRVPACDGCGGDLKPRVVFFGENVPRPVVDDAWALFGEAEALLVIGSSLAVFSGYRFVKRAADTGIPVAIVNLGPTRGDPLAAVRVDASAGAVLPVLSARL
jgi:NAD-dependent deacetylase sirtuin 4